MSRSFLAKRTYMYIKITLITLSRKPNSTDGWKNSKTIQKFNCKGNILRDIDISSIFVLNVFCFAMYSFAKP